MCLLCTFGREPLLYNIEQQIFVDEIRFSISEIEERISFYKNEFNPFKKIQAKGKFYDFFGEVVSEEPEEHRQRKLNELQESLSQYKKCLPKQLELLRTIKN